MTIQELLAAAKLGDLTQAQLDVLADRWQNTTYERLVLDRKSKELKDLETAAAAVLIQQMRKSGAVVSTPTHKFGVNPNPEYVPHVMDWPAYWGHILATKDFSLLEKRPGKSACQERWQAGETIPGVEKYPVYKLKVI